VSIWQQTQGNGSDIVVLHGWGMNANVWTPLIPELAQHHRITVIDLPGFGDSNQEILSDNLGEVSAHIVKQLPAKFHLLGWSLGGLIATEIALNYPHRVQTLATVASSPHFIEAPKWPGIKPVLIRQFHQQIEQDFAKTIERFLAVQAMGSPQAKEQIKQVKRWVFDKPLGNPESLKNGLTILETADLRERLEDITCPFTRFYGRLDTLVPAKAIPLVNRLAPSSSQYLFEHCAHTPFVSASQSFADNYRQFVQRHD